MTHALMVQGTCSDAGKSVLTTGLCRLFSRMGYRTAPFKSQNMSQNTEIIPGEGEIAKSQVLQAQAAGVKPAVDMNPIILKPSTDKSAEVIVRGQRLANTSGSAYRKNFYSRALRAIKKSYKRLCSEYEVIIIEGAGSPVEMNLKDRELVNMKIAEMTGAPVIIAADIDRGGVLASIIGTWELLTCSERDRVAGFVVNKFRGDPALFEDGVTFIENKIDSQVLGVLPYLNISLEPEDSLSLKDSRVSGDKMRIGVVKLPDAEQPGDIYSLAGQRGVSVESVLSVRQALEEPFNGLIIPHSGAPLSDLQYLKEAGWEHLFKALGEGGVPLTALGSSAGFLGETFRWDELEVKGLNVLSCSVDGAPLQNSEVEKGTVSLDDDQPFFGDLSGQMLHVYRRCEMSFSGGNGGNFEMDGRSFGVLGRQSPVMAVPLNGLFNQDDFRGAYLQCMNYDVTDDGREDDFDLLADTINRKLDMETIFGVMGLETA